MSPGCCANLTIDIAGEPFILTCHDLALGSFDMVLGVQWLESLGSVLWDFCNCTLTFVRDGHHVLWSTNAASTPRATIAAVSIDIMDDLLLQNVDLFAAPTCRRPAQQQRHHIHLQPGTGAIAVRPYRYAHGQKEKLQHQCDEMLQLSVILLSRSVFLAPVLLVNKSNGSWNFYVDYRALNVKTIKDKFPIPVMEELLDELHGATFFTKLGFRSSYHQVQMCPDDIRKMAF
jgi:hypothetical protein